MPITRASLEALAREAGFSPAYYVQSLRIGEREAEFTVYSVDPTDARVLVRGDDARTFTWTSSIVGEWPGARVNGADIVDVAAALVMHRRHLGLTRTQVATRMGCSKHEVRWIERNMPDADLESVYRYARALDLRLQITVEDAGGER